MIARTPSSRILARTYPAGGASVRNVAITRRDLAALVGGAAAWPLAAGAQTGQRMRRIGVLQSGFADNPEIQSRILALRAGLAALGWIEGTNYQFELRGPGADPDRIKAAASELVRIAPDVIVVGTTPGALQLRQETTSIPIVFANLADPVGSGLIASLARTGGNITGFTAFEFATAGKWLELLEEIAPNVRRAAMVFGGPEIGPTGEKFYSAVEPVAATLGVELTPIRIRTAADIAPAIAAFAAKPDGGILAAAEIGAVQNRAPIIAAAARHALPAVYPFRFFVTEGGLASYGVDINDQYRRAASYLDRILRGAKAAELPVQAPDKFALVVNLKTARALGFSVPPLLLARADEVIE
jgi:putative ABC transport system substrate-binding protein